MAEAMPISNQTERNTQNEYVPSITQELSRKSHSNHSIITIGKNVSD